VADLGDLATAALVAEMDPQSTEAGDVGGIDDAHHRVGVVGAEPAFEGDGGIGQPPGLQGLQPLPGFEDVQRPVLPVALRVGHSRLCHRECFIEPVECDQGPTAEVVGQPGSHVLRRADPGGAVEVLQRGLEPEVLVLQATVGQF